QKDRPRARNWPSIGSPIRRQEIAARSSSGARPAPARRRRVVGLADGGKPCSGAVRGVVYTALPPVAEGAMKPDRALDETSPPDAGAPFPWANPLLFEASLSNEEGMVRDSARAYCQEKLFPRVLEANRHEHFDREIMREMGALGFLGATIA